MPRSRIGCSRGPHLGPLLAPSAVVLSAAHGSLVGAQLSLTVVLLLMPQCSHILLPGLLSAAGGSPGPPHLPSRQPWKRTDPRCGPLLHLHGHGALETVCFVALGPRVKSFGRKHQAQRLRPSNISNSSFPPASAPDPLGGRFAKRHEGRAQRNPQSRVRRKASGTHCSLAGGECSGGPRWEQHPVSFLNTPLSFPHGCVA